MASANRQTKLNAWYLATRPRTLVASFVPMAVAATAALADGVFRTSIFFLALIALVSLQIAANLINEYADYRRGADELKQAGQGMTIKNQILTPAEVRNGAIATTLLGCVIGLFLVTQSGIYLLWIGLGGVLVAITYTAGPFPLAYNGLGEVAAGVFMGPLVVVGAYYAMQPDISVTQGVLLALLAFPIMFTTAAILHANNIRDLEADKAVNKRTLAVIFGLDIARLEYRLLLTAAYVSQFLLIVMQLLPLTTLITLLIAPKALELIMVIQQETDPKKLHIVQGRTAQFHGRYGGLLIIGWLAGILLGV